MASPTNEELLAVYREAKTIAVVGASSDPSKPAHVVPAYLKEQGYRVVPVSPRGGEIFGERVYAALSEVDVPVDVVDVFRPSAEAPEIARQAAALGAKVLWLQAGVWSQEAEAIAAGAGMTVVMDRCIGATHGQLGLGPGPY